MNNTLINLYQTSINKYLKFKINDEKLIKDKSKLNFICKFSELGLRFQDENKFNLKNFELRDKILFILNSNKQLFDKKIQSILFNKEPIINKYDLFFYQIIIFSLLFNLSKGENYFINNDEFYIISK